MTEDHPTPDVDDAIERARQAVACSKQPPRRKVPWLKIATVVAAILVSLVLLSSQHSSSESRQALQEGIRAKDQAIQAKDRTIKLQADTIRNQGTTLSEVKTALSKFTQSDACLNAYNQRSSEALSAYLTDGLGGLVSSLTTDTPDRRDVIAAAEGRFKGTLTDYLNAVAARKAYSETNPRPTVCPIPTND
jgi:septal ring factor EnvC (AmiA/AmiB activator)